MAINNDSIEAIEVVLGIEKGTLGEAITKEEEVTLEIPQLQRFTEDELKSRDEAKLSEGNKLGHEMVLKSMKEKLGLEFEGRKDPDKFIEAFKESVLSEAKIEPDKKIQELKKDNDALIKNNETLQGEFDQFKQGVQVKERQRDISSDFSKSIKAETIISHSAIMSEAKAQGYDFDIEEGKTIVKQNGDVMKDTKTMQPISVDSFTSDFVKPYLKGAEGGRGEGNGTPPMTGTLDAFNKQWEADGKNVGSEDYNKATTKAVSEGSLTL